MSDPFRPWVRPCACVGSGPKKIGRSVVAPEVPVGCHQPTPPPTYRPPEMVTTINNGLVYQCLSMLDFRETCWTKKNDTRKSFKLSVVVVKMIDLPQFPGWNNDPDLTWGQMSGMKMIYVQHFLKMGNSIGNLEWLFIRPPNFCLCPPRITIGSPSKKNPDIDPQVVRKKVV